MKFLIDECLSPDLTQLAWDAGFECAHVGRIGRRGAKDWQHVQRAIDGDWILVTRDTTDFVALVGREEMHPGLVCINFADGHQGTRENQKLLFRHALNYLAGLDPVNEVLEVTLNAGGRVITERYRWPR